MHRKKHNPSLNLSCSKYLRFRYLPKLKALSHFQFDETSRLEFRFLFPKVFCVGHQKKNLVLLGLGGNIGDCLKRFQSLIRMLERNPHIQLLSASPIYRNPPFGFLAQGLFSNATLEFETSYNMVEVFRMIFYWERRFGRARKREFKNAPRTLDLDLLCFNHMKVRRPYLIIPHPFWNQRESVLVPLHFQKLVSKRA